MWNVANNQKYMKAIHAGEKAFESEILDIKTRYNEYVMTSLRTMWGCSEQKIESFGQAFLIYFLDQIKSINPGHIFNQNDCWKLSPAGKHFADKIAMELFYV